MSHGASSNIPDLPGAIPATVFDDPVPELTRTYAEALLRAAEAAGDIEPVLDELDELIADVWNAHPEFDALMSSPTMPAHEKDRILVRIFDGRAQPIVVNFLRVLNRRGRLALLRPIARRARAELDRRLNRRPVTVRTARPLDDDLLAGLRDRLTAMLGGATPVVHVEVDPALVGGLTIQVGDHIYDASIRGRLNQIHRRLVEQQAHTIRARAHELVALA